MWPEPAFIGPFGFSLYGAMVAAGALAGLLALRRAAPWAGWAPRAAEGLGFWLIVAGLFGARLFYVVFHWPEFSGRPLSALEYWRGGLMFQGAVAAAALAALAALKARGQSFWAFADAVAPALALGQGLGRLGCFAAGCCYGRPAPPGPFSVAFPPGGSAPPGFPLYPAQLMESLGLMALFLGLYRFLKKRPPKGRVFGYYLLLAGLLRAAMEQFRGDFRGSPVFGQAPTFWLAALAALAGLLALALARRPRA